MPQSMTKILDLGGLATEVCTKNQLPGYPRSGLKVFLKYSPILHGGCKWPWEIKLKMLCLLQFI